MDMATRSLPSVCILARKRLYSNTRVVRQTRSLLDAGFDVTVAAIEVPSEELRALVPEAEFRTVKAITLPQRVMRAHSLLRAAVSPQFWYRWTVTSVLNRVRAIAGVLQVHAPAVYPRLRMALLHATEIARAARNVLTSIAALAFRGPARMLAPARSKAARRAIRRAIRVVLRLLGLAGACMPETLTGRRRGLVDLLKQWLAPYAVVSGSLDFGNRVAREFAGRCFTVVQAHDSYALYGAYKLSRQCGGRILYDALEIPVERSRAAATNKGPEWLRRWARAQERRYVRAADAVTAIGPSLGAWTAEHYGIAIPVVVRNCALYADIVPDGRIKADLSLTAQDCLLVTVGSIYEGQGIEQMMAAMAWLDPRVHVAALGPISDQYYVENLRRELVERGVAHRIHILPPQAPHLLLQYASGADAGLIARQDNSANNRYSLPNKIFEMVMARLPVFTGTLQDIRAIVEQHRIGAVFDESDPADIAHVVNAVLADGLLPTYRANVMQAAQELCWEREAGRYIEVVRALAGADRVASAQP